MPQVERASDVKEQLATRATLTIAPGVVLLGLGALMLVYRNDWLIGLAIVLAVVGVGLIGYGGYVLSEMRKITHFGVACPFCKYENDLTEKPVGDLTCRSCARLIPIGPDGKALNVYEVRCGFCNELNFYTDKSVGLICEECGREIPIAFDESDPAVRERVERMAARDDDGAYNLVLVSKGRDPEKLIEYLQRLLALNRGQVKELLEEMPATLLYGIPSRKADLLIGDLRNIGAKANKEEAESGAAY
jgi:hypothetical protein